MAKVSFTGGDPDGARAIAREHGREPHAGVLELGGKSAFVICEDADLDAAVADALMGIAFQNGEVCFAASRLLRARVACTTSSSSASRGARTAPDRRRRSIETTQVGPLVSRAHRERVHGFVERARGEGARS